MMRAQQSLRRVLSVLAPGLPIIGAFAVAHRLYRRGRNALRDASGVAAVEFAVIAPLLFLLLIAAYEVSRAISLDRRFHLITSMTGDLVSREQDMGTNPATSVAGIMKIIDHVMGSDHGGALEIEIIPVMAFGQNGASTRTYAPSYKRSKDGTIRVSKPRCTSYDLPPGMLGLGGSAIVVTASYEYTPLPFAKSLLSPMTWSETSTHSPRHGCVDFEGNNCAVNCR